MWAGLVPSKAVKDSMSPATILASGGPLSLSGIPWKESAENIKWQRTEKMPYS